MLYPGVNSGTPVLSKGLIYLYKNNTFFFNWDSLHARLNYQYEAWSYKRRSTKRLQDPENLFRKNLQLKDVTFKQTSRHATEI